MSLVSAKLIVTSYFSLSECNLAVELGGEASEERVGGVRSVLGRSDSASLLEDDL